MLSVFLDIRKTTTLDKRTSKADAVGVERLDR